MHYKTLRILLALICSAMAMIIALVAVALLFAQTDSEFLILIVSLPLGLITFICAYAATGFYLGPIGKVMLRVKQLAEGELSVRFMDERMIRAPLGVQELATARYERLPVTWRPKTLPGKFAGPPRPPLPEPRGAYEKTRHHVGWYLPGLFMLGPLAASLVMIPAGMLLCAIGMILIFPPFVAAFNMIGMYLIGQAFIFLIWGQFIFMLEAIFEFDKEQWLTFFTLALVAVMATARFIVPLMTGGS